jgi:hypothetical protein
MEAAVTPLPKPDNTPPVTTIYLDIILTFTEKNPVVNAVLYIGETQINQRNAKLMYSHFF